MEFSRHAAIPFSKGSSQPRDQTKEANSIANNLMIGNRSSLYLENSDGSDGVCVCVCVCVCVWE